MIKDLDDEKENFIPRIYFLGYESILGYCKSNHS